MIRQSKANKGFSFVELLIAIAILSIIMVMIVQFMSTSSGAYQRTKKNLNLQTDSMQIMQQFSDTMMQATYVRVQTQDKNLYTVKDSTSGSMKNKMSDESDSEPATYKNVVDYDFVPDDFANYIDNTGTEQKVIVDVDNSDITAKYAILKSSNSDEYTGADEPVINVPGESITAYPDKKLRSFRRLVQIDPSTNSKIYYYVKPEYIYVEYPSKDATKTNHVMYYISKSVVDKEDNTYGIYVYRTDEETNFNNALKYMESNIDKIGTKDSKIGLITDKLAGFYLSADVDGNAFLYNILFTDNIYEYSAVDTVICRNSNVLTVRPSKLLKKKTASTESGTGGSTEGGT